MHGERLEGRLINVSFLRVASLAYEPLHKEIEVCTRRSYSAGAGDGSNKYIHPVCEDDGKKTWVTKW
jgi:hypothetical protein